MYKTIYDDGFQAYLTQNAAFVGDPPMPALMNINNVEIPKDIIPFEKAKHYGDKDVYVHFYMHDIKFAPVLKSTNKYIDLLKQYSGVISPDPSLIINQLPYLQQTNTYLNRAVAFYLQEQGIPVIPNVRWSNESSFSYCFNGVPHNSIISVSTHGCVKTTAQKEMFKIGLEEALNVLTPTDVLVHGAMPNVIFDDFLPYVRFHRYASEIEKIHDKRISLWELHIKVILDLIIA